MVESENETSQDYDYMARRQQHLQAVAHGGTVPEFCSNVSFSFHLFKTTNGQMATDMFIVKQNMIRLIATMNKHI